MLCPNCVQIYTPALMNSPDYEEKFQRWKYGRELIQKVWPDATPIEREQLQTGICSDKCWDQYLGAGE